jgi:hypothetical protein
MLFAHRVRLFKRITGSRVFSINSLDASEHASTTVTKESQSAMVTKARTVKIADLSSVIDQAVQASAGRPLPGGTLVGRQIAASLAAKINPNDLARDITKQVKAAVPDATLTPKVIKEGKTIICGFIVKPQSPIQ